MDSFKTIIAFILVAACGIEAGLVPAVAPAVAPAFAPAPLAYANFAPYNIPPYAASVNAYTRTLALPAGIPAAGVLPPYAAPVAPAVAAAPVLRAGPGFLAPGLVGTPYAAYPGAFPVGALPVGRSVHAVAPALAPAVPAGLPFPGAYGAAPAAPVSAYQGVLPAPIY